MKRFLICCAVGLALLLGASAPTPASAYYYRHYHHYYHPYYHHYYHPYYHRRHYRCWWRHGHRYCRWW
jgi:hypothetical protein